MRKFEYQTLLNCQDEGLNNLGIEGWELISVYKIHPENMYTKFVFKKEIL